MRVTTQGEYGIRCMICIAKHPENMPVSIQKILVEEALPKNYAEQLLLKLRRRGLIRSVRGVKGGYLLARSASKITLKDMIEALEGTVFEITCNRRHAGKIPCVHDGCCSLSPVWQAIRTQITGYLDSVSLQQLADAESHTAF